MLVQSMDSITALDDRGDPLPIDNQQATWEFLAHNTMSAAEMDIPLRLPPRAAGRIASLRGTLEVVFPGREAEFRFEDLANAENVQQQQANVTVVLQSVRRTAALHDVRILVRLALRPGRWNRIGVGSTTTTHTWWMQRGTGRATRVSK